jgi:hypothetical protein
VMALKRMTLALVLFVQGMNSSARAGEHTHVQERQRRSGVVRAGVAGKSVGDEEGAYRTEMSEFAIAAARERLGALSATLAASAAIMQKALGEADDLLAVVGLARQHALDHRVVWLSLKSAEEAHAGVLRLVHFLEKLGRDSGLQGVLQAAGSLGARVRRHHGPTAGIGSHFNTPETLVRPRINT